MSRPSNGFILATCAIGWIILILDLYLFLGGKL